jgi:hypothetical protein
MTESVRDHSFVDQLVDAVGAGNALLAYSTLATMNEVVATLLGGFAAAVECECDGNVPVTSDGVHAKIDAVERQMSFA